MGGSGHVVAAPEVDETPRFGRSDGVVAARASADDIAGDADALDTVALILPAAPAQAAASASPFHDDVPTVDVTPHAPSAAPSGAWATLAGGTRGRSVRPSAGTSCVACGKPLDPDHAFCGYCGAARPQPTASVAAPSAPPQAEPLPWGHLALIDDEGRESAEFALHGDQCEIGATATAGIALTDSVYLAPVHCRLRNTPDGALLEPIDVCNGVYVRITAPTALGHGDVIRIGQEVLRLERREFLQPERNTEGAAESVGWTPPPAVWGRLCQLGMSREVANAYLLSAADVFLGRERGDILFPRDGFVSAQHAVLSDRDGQCYLKDLGSSNGTFVKLTRGVVLRDGDLFLLGRNLLRFQSSKPLV